MSAPLRVGTPLNRDAGRRTSMPINPVMMAVVTMAVVLMTGIFMATKNSTPANKGIEPARLTPTATIMTVPIFRPNLPQQTFGQKQVTLIDYPDRKWLSYYLAHRQWLGEPVWGERPYGTQPSCVGFSLQLVCLNPDPAVAGSLWRFLPLLLGEASLPPGISRQPSAPLDPLVQSFVTMHQAAGEDTYYWLGEVISGAYCSQDSGSCFQTFQRARLVWRVSDTDPDSVQLSPLGLSINPGQ